jgi:hypothetical protein
MSDECAARIASFVTGCYCALRLIEPLLRIIEPLLRITEPLLRVIEPLLRITEPFTRPASGYRLLLTTSDIRHQT